MKVVDGDGLGLELKAQKEMSGSALPYTPHEIENAGHWFELSKPQYTVVKVSGEHMGVAGDDSWGARPHPEYIVDSGCAHQFKFTMRGIG